MAGAGYRVFSAGAVLTAAQVNTFLMEQSVMNFAGTAARGSALASVLSAGQVAHVGGGTLTVYDGSNWQQFAPIGAANRNILFNGAMQVSQRGTSTASITTAGYYTADRYYLDITTLGTWTQDIQADAPTGSGFRNSLRMLCTTAQASPAVGAFARIEQRLEGQDVQRLLKGTSSAQQVTLSFWVKSTTTGTYIARLLDNDNTRHVSASYTISAANTWERKTITFPVDTSGVFDNDNAYSLGVQWWLGAGTNFTSGTLATTWASATNANAAVGQTNLAATLNNSWQITGVQLEVGSQATAFEFKSFGQDLRECQRYYVRLSVGAAGVFGTGICFSSTQASGMVRFAVPMRAAPTALEQSGTASHYQVWNASGVLISGSTVPTYNSTTNAENGFVILVVASGLVAGNATGLLSANSAAYLGWSAEL